MTSSGGNLEASKEFRQVQSTEEGHQAQGQKSKEELAALKSQVQLQVDAADQKGYDEGYDKVTLKYKAQVRDIMADIYSDRFKAGAKWYHKHLMAALNPSEGSYIRTLFEPPAELLKLPNPIIEDQRAEPNKSLRSRSHRNSSSPYPLNVSFLC